MNILSAERLFSPDKLIENRDFSGESLFDRTNFRKYHYIRVKLNG